MGHGGHVGIFDLQFAADCLDVVGRISHGQLGSVKPPEELIGMNDPSNVSIVPLEKSAAHNQSAVPLLPMARRVYVLVDVTSVTAVVPCAPFHAAIAPESVSKMNSALPPVGSKKEGVKLNTWPVGLGGVETTRVCGIPASF
jgi:hypothetical protein